jgi:hypothetical protein
MEVKPSVALEIIGKHLLNFLGIISSIIKACRTLGVFYKRTLACFYQPFTGYEL